MKKLVLIFIACYSFSYSQNGPVAAGTSTNSSGGSVSYSIGQIDYIAPIGSGGNNNEGLQQPYELFVVSTSLSEKDKISSIKVFPNPTTHSVIIDLINTEQKDISYQLTDANGKLISENKIKEQTSTVDVSELAAGIYFINISSGLSPTNTYKLIKH